MNKSLAEKNPILQLKLKVKNPIKSSNFLLKITAIKSMILGLSEFAIVQHKFLTQFMSQMTPFISMKKSKNFNFKGISKNNVTFSIKVI